MSFTCQISVTISYIWRIFYSEKSGPLKVPRKCGDHSKWRVSSPQYLRGERPYLRILPLTILLLIPPQTYYDLGPLRAHLEIEWERCYILISAVSTGSLTWSLFWFTPLKWRRQWYPTPVLLPGKSHGWRSLVGCSPWGLEESDMTERLHFHFSLLCIGEGNGNPLQCSCLENPRDGVAQSRTRLKWLSSSSSIPLKTSVLDDVEWLGQSILFLGAGQFSNSSVQ